MDLSKTELSVQIHGLPLDWRIRSVGEKTAAQVGKVVANNSLDLQKLLIHQLFQRATSVALPEATAKGGKSVVTFGVASGEPFGGGIESREDRGVQSGHEQAVTGTLMVDNIEEEHLGKFKDPEGIPKTFLYSSKLGVVGPSKKRKVASFSDMGNELIHHLWVGENGGKETCKKVPDHRSGEEARSGCIESSNSRASVVVPLQPRVHP
uniref:Uncharacterized protein n=1 Tax=Nelumbo nucifera TaxID=4432 RepID=A0A822ZVY2_NELNU|nr:TPA_asm: hypothetical protein HUJ06_017366 [Nelumbo nucifera]